jgi:PAP2 superfamily C-terminal
MGWLYLFRSITIVVTTLPSPLRDGCIPPTLSISGSVSQRFGAFFETVAGNDQSCGDNIFSGHTCVMASCALAWRIHARAHKVLGWLLYLIAAAGILMIIFTHYHYTIDVLLALCKSHKILPKIFTYLGVKIIDINFFYVLLQSLYTFRGTFT